MDIFECIEKRRSVRKYLDVPVEWDKIGTILNAARLTPSAGNLQSWKFVIVTDEEKRKKIAEACLQQYWMEIAPVHIVVCAELKKIKQFYGTRGERLYSIQNCAAAAENIMLAAHALGLGSCWIGAFEEDAINRILDIPDEIRPQMVITIGYPDKTEVLPDNPKYTLENVTYLEKWGPLGRVKDIESVLWNFRVAERGAKMAKDLFKEIKKSSAPQRKKLLERFKESTKDIGERIKSKIKRGKP